ncbi:MAG TPA: hypothetical protein VFE29_06750 [Terriglobia bacterium]|jgi:hypothetical protein|nr:hypothetical protein [Terriglobia bacterium]
MTLGPFRYGRYLSLAALVGTLGASLLAMQRGPAGVVIPRTADGKPDLHGIWQSDGKASGDVQPFVEGGAIPYKPEAQAKKAENQKSRATADPLESCFMPGVPRIMYLTYPYQIFQTKDHIAMTFEWSSVYRLIYMSAKEPKHPGVDSWMGDSRGHWDGDTLVVDVVGSNDRTWFDQAGNYHSDKMRITERYTLTDPDTIRYEATITDPEVFTRPWKIIISLRRIKNKARVLEFQCQAEKEEKNGAFERDSRTWYPKR